MKRREFLKRALLAAVPPAGAGRGSAAPGPGDTRPAKTRPDVVIYEGSYPGWPWIASAPDGTLYCAFREGTEHDYSASGRAMLASSADRGRTWSAAAVIADEPGVDDRNVAVAVLPDGELLVSYISYDEARQSQAMTIGSADRGKTWSAPRPLDRPNTRTKSAAAALAERGLLLPYYVAPGNGSLAALSADGGATWTTVAVPDAEGFLGDEWDVLEMEPGLLLGVFRNSHAAADGTFFRSLSRDGGRTWSVPQPTNVRSLRHSSPAQVVMQQGVPTIVYSDRRMVSVSAVTTSDPEFLAWDVDRRLACYTYNPDESPIADGSYPVSAPIDERTRLIVDYEIRPETRRIAGYFVTFPADWGSRGKRGG